MEESGQPWSNVSEEKLINQRHEDEEDLTQEEDRLMHLQQSKCRCRSLKRAGPVQ